MRIYVHMIVSHPVARLLEEATFFVVDCFRFWSFGSLAGSPTSGPQLGSRAARSDLYFHFMAQRHAIDWAGS